jgi:putative tryptophan/tyrosine transport system substrate-binding protein
MKRREFITFLGGGIAAWPLAAQAQQPERMRRIGMLVNFAEGDTEGRRRIDVFLKSMSELGWIDGKTFRIDYRWGVEAQIVTKNAAELVALAPDVIVANAPPSVQALKQVTQTIPLVFVGVTDPVALGIVQSLARPGGNATGFSPAELGMSPKWLQLLKEIVPDVKRVAVFEDPGNTGGVQQFAAIQSAAPSVGVDLSVIDVRDADKIEREVEAFASSGGSGLIVLRTSEDIAVRDVIIAAAVKHRLPAVYPLRFMATEGGLVSYGPDIVDEFRQAAGYVDRILKGENPADLPVQAATKFELVINLKTAKALGLSIPQTLLATADEVIE